MCLQPQPAPPTANWPTYTNSTYGFNFKYPPGSERFFETTNSILIKMPIAPGTNLTEKYLQMSVRENVNPCQSPLSDTSRPGSPTETVVFNGISFFKQIGGDAGISQVHEWVGYSTLKNNACISMDFVLHSVNGSYPPPPDFDKAAESSCVRSSDVNLCVECSPASYHHADPNQHASSTHRCASTGGFIATDQQAVHDRCIQWLGNWQFLCPANY